MAVVHRGALVDYGDGRVANAVTLISGSGGTHRGGIVDFGDGRLAQAVQVGTLVGSSYRSGNVTQLATNGLTRAVAPVAIGAGVHKGPFIDFGDGRLTRAAVEVSSLGAGQSALPVSLYDASTGAAVLTRSSFIAQLLAIPGSANVAFGFAPAVGDTTTSTSFDTNARTITHDADASARITAQGQMAVQSYTAASSQYSTAPDTLSLSFGNGTVDMPCWWAALINTSDTASNKTIFSKWNNVGAREYLITVTSAELLAFQVYDDSVGAVAAVATNAAIALGSWLLVGGVYDGRGGNAAHLGMSLTVNAAAPAQTQSISQPTGDYVAMENLAAPFEIGSILTHTAQFFQGSQGFVMACAGTPSAGHMTSVKTIVNAGFSMSL